MGKVNKLQCKHDSRAVKKIQHPLKVLKDVHSKKKPHKAVEKKDWEDVTCSVCMEFPHNAVLLLCSSYNKGCRPYMCATGRRFSNCLEQYKKAYTKVCSIENSRPWNGVNGPMYNLGFSSTQGEPEEKTDVPELLCPLCRGQVKGWTVVEPARQYFDAKKRTCLQENCSFAGTYKQLRKHVKAKHPLARPREVDPLLQEKWRKLESERERSDVISTIVSSTPGAVIMGDYVLEPNPDGIYSDSDSELDEDSDSDDFGFRSFDIGGLFSRRMIRRNNDFLDDNDFSRAPLSNSAFASRRGSVRGRGVVRSLGGLRGGGVQRRIREPGRFL
ncbi:uncharacterized protein [Pyrus communis]|uniref:uncharacterized protein n=1 Tax=Pyrus communis TaxID=23211 RepID=UPI0035C101B3